MGDTHFRSNIKGQAGTETLTNFATVGDSSTALVGSTVTSSGAVISGSYVRVGTNKYLMTSTKATAASILAEATAINNAVAETLVLAEGAMFFVAAPATIYQINATALT